MSKKYIDAAEFVQHLKDQQLVIVHRSVLEGGLVDGARVDDYRRRVMQKPFLTQLEIAKSGVWGKITKAAVRAIVQKLPEDQVIKDGYAFKVPVHIVKNIAVRRNALTAEELAAIG